MTYNFIILIRLVRIDGGGYRLIEFEKVNKVKIFSIVLQTYLQHQKNVPICWSERHYLCESKLSPVISSVTSTSIKLLLNAAIAALSNNLIDVLVTDEITGESLLSHK